MPTVIPDKPILNVPAHRMATLLETLADGSTNKHVIKVDSAPEVLTYYDRPWYYRGTSDGMAWYTSEKEATSKC